nr:hypothetical protein [Enterococcus lactis]
MEARGAFAKNRWKRKYSTFNSLCHSFAFGACR